MEEGHKVRVKLGDLEFEAHGAEESVKAEFNAFLELVRSGTLGGQIAVAVKKVPENKEPAGELLKPEVSNPDASAGGDNKRSSDLGLPAGSEKLFRHDEKHGVVSLKFMPHTGKSQVADAVILVLCGFHFLRGEDEVIVGKIKSALEQSGARLTRVDRHTDRSVSKGYLIKTGIKSGGKYRLTNMGLEIAKKLLEEMVEKVI